MNLKSYSSDYENNEHMKQYWVSYESYKLQELSPS